MPLSETLILAPEDSQPLASQVAQTLDIPLLVGQSQQFGDGEWQVRIPQPERLKDNRVIVLGSTYGGPGGGALRHEVMVDLMYGAKGFEAPEVHGMLSSMGGMTAERFNLETGELAKGANRFNQLIAALHGEVAKALFVGLHTERIADGVDREKWVNIIPDEVIANLILREMEACPGIAPEQMCVVSPDAGFANRATAIGKSCGLETICGLKERTDMDVVEIQTNYASVKGKVVFIVDDMIRTGGTIAQVAQRCTEAGALKVVLLSPHLILAGKSRQKIAAAGAQKVIGLDTIPGREPELGIDVYSCAPLIAQALQEHVLINQ